MGLTFFLENGDIFWIGSLLDIDEAREVFSNKFSHKMNATTVQVVGGYLSGIMFAVEQHRQGNKKLYVPDDLPAQDIFNKMKMFYGEFVFTKVDNWDFRNINRRRNFSTLREPVANIKCEWKLKDFLINPDVIIGMNCYEYYKLTV